MITEILIIVALILLFGIGLLVCLMVSVPIGNGIQPKTNPRDEPPKGSKL